MNVPGREGVVTYRPISGAILVARRAFRNERNVMFVVGMLVFYRSKEHTFDCVLSYSVIQHYREVGAKTALDDIGLILGHGGYSKCPNLNRIGCAAGRPVS